MTFALNFFPNIGLIWHYVNLILPGHRCYFYPVKILKLLQNGNNIWKSKLRCLETKRWNFLANFLLDLMIYKVNMFAYSDSHYFNDEKAVQHNKHSFSFFQLNCWSKITVVNRATSLCMLVWMVLSVFMRHAFDILPRNGLILVKII